MMTFVLAWRNLWRNPRRTLLTAAALGLGVATMVSAVAYMDGMFGHMLATSANGRAGHAQLHAPGYQQTREEDRTLKKPDALADKAAALPAVANAAVRVWGSALVAIGDRNRGVQLLGVDPERELTVGKWPSRLKAGRFLSPNAASDSAEVVLGYKLVKRLEIELDTRVVVTAADIHTGEARSELLKVVGFLKSGDPLLDSGVVITHRATSGRLLGLKDEAHEIALRLVDPEAQPGVGVDRTDKAAVESAIAPLNSDDVEAIPWHAVQPMIAEMVKMQGAWMGVTMGLIFFVIAFIIVGTMSMALLERSWEFGLLRALGSGPLTIAMMMLAEAAWLGALGASFGVAVGHGINLWLQHVGIDLSDVEFAVAFHEPIRPVPDLGMSVALASIFVVLTVLVSVVAAFRATRVQPGVALRQR